MNADRETGQQIGNEGKAQAKAFGLSQIDSTRPC